LLNVKNDVKTNSTAEIHFAFKFLLLLIWTHLFLILSMIRFTLVNSETTSNEIKLRVKYFDIW